MRKYMASWHSGMFVAGKNKVDDNGYFHNRMFETEFTEALGYNRDEIVQIHSLNVGDVWESPIYGDAHLVKRLE